MCEPVSSTGALGSAAAIAADDVAERIESGVHARFAHPAEDALAGLAVLRRQVGARDAARLFGDRTEDIRLRAGFLRRTACTCRPAQGAGASSPRVALSSVGSTRTTVVTEFAMKHRSCASTCIATCSASLGCLPEKRTRGRSITSVIASFLDALRAITPAASSE